MRRRVWGGVSECGTTGTGGSAGLVIVEVREEWWAELNNSGSEVSSSWSHQPGEGARETGSHGELSGWFQQVRRWCGAGVGNTGTTCQCSLCEKSQDVR